MARRIFILQIFDLQVILKLQKAKFGYLTTYFRHELICICVCVCVFGYVVLNFWLNIRSQNFLWSIYLSKEKKKISNFFTMNDRLDDELNNPVPLQLEPVPLSRDVLRTFPTVGTVLRVIFDQGMQKHLLRFLHSGKWVKFVNVLCEVHSGLWRGVLTPFTKLQYTPNEDHLVSAWQRFLLLLKL